MSSRSRRSPVPRMGQLALLALLGIATAVRASSSSFDSNSIESLLDPFSDENQVVGVRQQDPRSLAEQWASIQSELDSEAPSEAPVEASAAPPPPPPPPPPSPPPPPPPPIITLGDYDDPFKNEVFGSSFQIKFDLLFTSMTAAQYNARIAQPWLDSPSFPQQIMYDVCYSVALSANAILTSQWGQIVVPQRRCRPCTGVSADSSGVSLTGCSILFTELEFGSRDTEGSANSVAAVWALSASNIFNLTANPVTSPFYSSTLWTGSVGGPYGSWDGYFTSHLDPQNTPRPQMPFVNNTFFARRRLLDGFPGDRPGLDVPSRRQLVVTSADQVVVGVPTVANLQVAAGPTTAPAPPPPPPPFGTPGGAPAPPPPGIKKKSSSKFVGSAGFAVMIALIAAFVVVVIVVTIVLIRRRKPVQAQPEGPPQYDAEDVKKPAIAAPPASGQTTIVIQQAPAAPAPPPFSPPGPRSPMTSDPSNSFFVPYGQERQEAPEVYTVYNNPAARQQQPQNGLGPFGQPGSRFY